MLSSLAPHWSSSGHFGSFSLGDVKNDLLAERFQVAMDEIDDARFAALCVLAGGQPAMLDGVSACSFGVAPEQNCPPRWTLDHVIEGDLALRYMHTGSENGSDGTDADEYANEDAPADEMASFAGNALACSSEWVWKAASGVWPLSRQLLCFCVHYFVFAPPPLRSPLQLSVVLAWTRYRVWQSVVLLRHFRRRLLWLPLRQRATMTALPLCRPTRSLRGGMGGTGRATRLHLPRAGVPTTSKVGQPSSIARLLAWAD
ncbi:hypothetical protein CYMTET_43687 [Cymbomonas tetramitiformis]|uniref:Uncharacterized protein n=1 Tax=Cymbomonas tetramitiformis TaxID=36881 RepID=A0AAE0F0A9_9CHLO|nr:hypothetical protein CYMTET_43687 [Cymbomonas tetramitiformis]